MVASNAFGRGFGSKRLGAIIRGIPKLTDGKYIPSLTELMAIDSVSDKTAETFLLGLVQYRIFEKEIGLKCISTKNTNASTSPQGKLAGQVVVFTGFRDAKVKSKVEEIGGEVGETITKKTTILLTKDMSSTSSKIEKAKQSGIQVMHIDDFLNKYMK